MDLDELLGLIRDERYFGLHAPRQTGKTSVLLALRDLLNASGEYRCVYANVEAAQAMGEDVAEGMRAVLSELALEASVTLNDETLEGIWPDALDRAGPLVALQASLARWCMADPKPLVLLIRWPASAAQRSMWRCVCASPSAIVRSASLRRTLHSTTNPRVRPPCSHRIVFDRAPDRTWEEKIFRREAPAGAGGVPITVWGM